MRTSDASAEAPSVDPPVDYVARVNRAIDHVIAHLDQPLRLDDVARVANFSPFHFHRVFRSLVGATLNKFVKRLRLERALFQMSHDPKRSLTEIALACGFSSSSDFTRSFKQNYGVPPSVFDLKTWRDGRREQLKSMVCSGDGHLLDRLPPGENPDGFEVALRDLPARSVAYVRVLDPFQGTGVLDAYERLTAWAEEHGAADGQWLGYMWEDPEIVPLEDCRYDAAVVLDDPGLQPRGDIGRFEFPPMRVAQVEVRGPLDLEQRAIDWLFGTWLPSSGYVPDEQPAFESWIGRPFAHGYEHFELFAQLPVKRG